jgi:hypothetical protein
MMLLLPIASALIKLIVVVITAAVTAGTLATPAAIGVAIRAIWGNLMRGAVR